MKALNKVSTSRAPWHGFQGSSWTLYRCQLWIKFSIVPYSTLQEFNLCKSWRLFSQKIVPNHTDRTTRSKHNVSFVKWFVVWRQGRARSGYQTKNNTGAITSEIGDPTLAPLAALFLIEVQSGLIEALYTVLSAAFCVISIRIFPVLVLIIN